MKLINTNEAADLLGITARRVRALISEGKLPAVQIGRDYVIEERALLKVVVHRKSGRPPRKKV